MNRQCNTPLLLAAVLLLGFASPALANSIAPTAYFFPGILPLMLGLALPASVLAAVLERPFVSRAGVRGYALWYSLQANLVSLVIGYATLPVGVAAIYTIGPLWSLTAVAMSVVSEGWYYQWRSIRAPDRLRWGWVVTGNIVSSFVLLLLPPLVLILKEALPDLERELTPYQASLFRGSVIASIVVFVGSFIVPGLLRRMKAVPNKPLNPTGAAPAGEL